MNRNSKVLAFGLISLILTACDQKTSEKVVNNNSTVAVAPIAATDLGPVFESTLDQGIDFAKAGTPSFIQKVYGLDGAESWGRWSNALLAPTIKLVFKEPLPQKFILIISAQASGSNGTLPVKVIVGDQENSIIIGNKGISENKVSFNLNSSQSTIEIIPPAPVVPKEQGWSSDTRKLGIGLAKITIVKN